MHSRRFIALLCCACVLLICAAGPVQAAPGNLIPQVPDWNQPSAYNVNGYPQWCSPTAGGNLMGYWEDVMGCTGLTDRAAFPASPAYPNTNGTWEQGLYHDGMIEMGWWMDTGSWQSSQGGGSPRPFPPGAGSTPRQNILNGLLTYASNSWTDNDYPIGAPAPGTGIVKVAYPNATGFTHDINMVGGGAITMQQMWTTYCGEIDAARPVEVTFDKWVDSTVPPGSMSIDGFSQTVETYPWDPNVDPHSVVGVGYMDITQGFQNNGQDEWFVCQDGWGTTGQYVAVPLDSLWLQNDYVTDVPEPACLAILVLGAVGLVRRRRRPE